MTMTPQDIDLALVLGGVAAVFLLAWWMANRRARHDDLHTDDWRGEGGQRR